MAKFTVNELAHKWANKNFTKKQLGRNGYATAQKYKANNKELYLNNKLVATHYRSYVFIERFDYTSSFGNGLNYYILAAYIPNKIERSNIIISDDILTEEILKDKDVFTHWYKSYFIEKNRQQFEWIALAKDFIYNNRATVLRVGDIHISTGLPNAIYNRHKGTINKIEINSSFCSTIYYGWGENNIRTVKPIRIKSKIGKLIGKKLKDFLSEEEIKELEFKEWYLEYKNLESAYNNIKGVFDINKEEARAIYNDPIRKEKREIKFKEYIRAKEIKKQEIRAEERKLHIKNYYAKLEAWCNGTLNENYSTIYSFTSSDVYTALRMGKHKNYECVETSLNVKVPIKEAKRLLTLLRHFKFFNNDIYEEVDLDHRNISISGYKVYKITSKSLTVMDGNTDNIVLKDCKCVIIGCHTIPNFEIERFLKHNNLNW